MHISQRVIEILKSEEGLGIRTAIALVAKVSERTVQNWVNSNDTKLTRGDCVNVIVRYTGLKRSEILTKEVTTSDPGDEMESVTESN